MIPFSYVATFFAWAAGLGVFALGGLFLWGAREAFKDKDFVFIHFAIFGLLFTLEPLLVAGIYYGVVDMHR